jgi:hypothetical protein
MELITRVLVGVIAAWIPMEGEDTRRSPAHVAAESVEAPVRVKRTLTVLQGAAEHFNKPQP